MKRSAILLAVGGLTLPSPTLAEEQGRLSVYGSIHPFVDNFRASGATPEGLSPETGGATQVTLDDYSGDNLPNRFRMTSGTSHVGFRGELRLSKHFWAFFQIENAVGPDGDPYILASAWASRNSGVGLKGTFGTLFVGNWDTPYKHPTLFVGPLRGLNPFDNALTGNPGFNVPGTTTQNGRASSRHDAAFNRRQGNSIQYWTPNIYGLSARFAVSLNEGRTREEFAPSINPILLSGLLSFEHGPFAVHYAYERHIDYFGTDWVGGSPGATFTNPSSMDDAHQVVVWYTLPTNTRLAAIVERLTYRQEDTVVGAVDAYQRDAIYGAIKQSLGDHAIWGSFGIAAAGSCTTVGNLPCTTNGLDGRQWSVGYTYSPAKTVDIYAAYYQMSNGRSASYALFPSPAPVAPGVTSQAFGVGIQYIFDFTVGFGGEDRRPDAAATPRERPKPAAAGASEAVDGVQEESLEPTTPEEPEEPEEPEAPPEPPEEEVAPDEPTPDEPAAP